LPARSLEVDGVGPLDLYVATALSGANTAPAADANSLRWNTGQERETWFTVLAGSILGPRR